MLKAEWLIEMMITINAKINLPTQQNQHWFKQAMQLLRTINDIHMMKCFEIFEGG